MQRALSQNKKASLPSPFSKKQVIQMLKKCPVDRLDVIFGACLSIITGMRQGEIGKLRKEWIYPKRNSIIHPDTKFSKTRFYNIPTNFMKILKRMMSLYPESDYLFPSPKSFKDKQRFWSQFSSSFSKMREILGVNQESPYKKNKNQNYLYTFHSFRDTFCCILIYNGIDIYVVKELMGHSNVSTTLRYYAFLPSKKRKSVVNSVFEKEKNVPKYPMEEEEIHNTTIQTQNKINEDVDPLKVLQRRLVEDEITKEEYIEKCKLLGVELNNKKDDTTYFG